MAEGSSDPPQLNPNGASHQRHNQHRSRRGRSRQSDNRNLNSNSYDPSPQYDNFHQGFKPHFIHDNSAHAMYYHPPYQQEDGARWRGRGGGRGGGRRGPSGGGSRGLNGSFGDSGLRRQRAGGDHGPYSGNNRGVGDIDGPSWRREETNRDLGHINEDQVTRSKKPRKFSQESRRGEQDPRDNKGPHSRENQASGESRRSADTRGENCHSELKEKTQTSTRGVDSNSHHDDPEKKYTGTKRRQGPIKPPKPPSQEDTGSERGARGQGDPGNGQSFQNTAKDEATWRSGRGQGRRAPLQDRGQRRTHHQDHRPGQSNWDKMPKSKETQTGCLIEQLSEEKYECMVCCDVIRLMAPVWSCQSCFHVFHLNCIKKWARSPASQADGTTLQHHMDTPCLLSNGSFQ